MPYKVRYMRPVSRDYINSRRFYTKGVKPFKSSYMPPPKYIDEYPFGGAPKNYRKKRLLTSIQKSRIAKNKKRALAIKSINKLKAAFRGRRLRKFLFKK